MVYDKREFVLLSVKWTKHSLVFWGTLSPDDAYNRSFGGYTDDITTCERYTLDEAKDGSPHFHEYNGETLRQLRKKDDDGTWIVKVDDLHKLGRLTTHYVCS